MENEPRVHGRHRTGVEAPESALLRIALIKRGWTLRVLAQHCDLAWVSIRRAISQGFPEKRTRLLVEAALGQPIWSSYRFWKRRGAMTAAIGSDPYLAEKTFLQVWATDHGIPYGRQGRIFKKAELIDALAHHLLQPKS